MSVSDPSVAEMEVSVTDPDVATLQSHRRRPDGTPIFMSLAELLEEGVSYVAPARPVEKTIRVVERTRRRQGPEKAETPPKEAEGAPRTAEATPGHPSTSDDVRPAATIEVPSGDPPHVQAPEVDAPLEHAPKVDAPPEDAPEVDSPLVDSPRVVRSRSAQTLPQWLPIPSDLALPWTASLWIPPPSDETERIASMRFGAPGTRIEPVPTPEVSHQTRTPSETVDLDPPAPSVEAPTRIDPETARTGPASDPPARQPAGRPTRRVVSKPAQAHRPRTKKHTGWKILAWMVGTVVVLAFATLMALWYYMLRVERDLPFVSETVATTLPTASFIYAADGSELARYGQENRVWVDLDEISPTVIDALVATEDRRFFDHSGTDWSRLVAAAWRSARGSQQGASTITMQLARNLYPEVAQHEPFERKAREILMAARIERTFTKRQILELYLNRMSFGHGAYGIEAAARTYFSKTAATLDLGEAAVIIGLLKGPTFYDPIHSPERSRERRDLVITSLRVAGRITPTDERQLQSADLGLHLAPVSSRSDLAPHFAEYVRSQVELWGRSSGYDMYRDGLRIHTSLDPFLQRMATLSVDRRAAELQDIANREWGSEATPFADFWRSNAALEDRLVRRSKRFQTLRAAGMDEGEADWTLRSDLLFMDSLRTSATRLEAGLVAIDPHTGLVRAWVGSRDFAQDQFDKVGSAHRQPGSTFKPFLYATALELGYTPNTLVEDAVRTYVNPRTGEQWRPSNAGGGASGRILTLRQALAGSRNTVAARLIHSVGPERVVRTAHKMGIVSDLLAVPSLALGTSEVTLLELASGLGTIVSEGIHHTPIVITTIEDANGKVLARFTPVDQPAISPNTAYTLLDMMRDVLRPGGTGFSVRGEFGLQGDLAGKTGTTQDNTDGWFVLLHPHYVVASWVGFNQPSVRFRSSYWGQGGHNAARVVGEFVSMASADPTTGFDRSAFQIPSSYRAPRLPSDRFAGSLVDPSRVRELREQERAREEAQESVTEPDESELDPG